MTRYLGNRLQIELASRHQRFLQVVIFALSP